MNHLYSIDARAEAFVQLGITPIKMADGRIKQYVNPNDSVQWQSFITGQMVAWYNKLYDNITDHVNTHGISILSKDAIKWLDEHLESFRS